MLGGAFEVNRGAAIDSIVTTIATPSGLTPIRAAQGITEVATANIVRAVRSISIERGHDPRKMALIAFGGAGPLHAVDVARALGTPKVIVPLYPGVWSAFGILSADILYSAQRTWMREIGATPTSELWSLIAELSTELIARARGDGYDPRHVVIEFTLGTRYKGQSHSLSISLASPSDAELAKSIDRFHADHERRFGHSSPGAPIEVVDVHVAVRRPRPRIDARVTGSRSVSAPSYRQVWFSAPDAIECPIYKREGLQPSHVIAGPAIVEQYDTTVVISSEDTFHVTEDGLALIINVSVNNQQ
jgi:N-methylhydantoinase A